MEQALVFASIVLGVAVAFELQNLHRLLRAEKVAWHWAQPLFALFVLLTIMAFWWILASRPMDEAVTLIGFLPIMWTLVILNLLAAAALPDEIGTDGIDLASYYQANRRYLWGLYIAALLPMWLGWILTGLQNANSMSEFLPYLTVEIVPLLLFTGLFFAKRWVFIGLLYSGLGVMTISWFARAI